MVANITSVTLSMIILLELLGVPKKTEMLIVGICEEIWEFSKKPQIFENDL